jgi:PKD repeat protein
MGFREIVTGRDLLKWRSKWDVSLLLATRLGVVGLLLVMAQPVNADPDLPVIPSRTTNVLSFSAIGDGTTDNAGSINAAITAIHNAGGGTVEISPGSASLTNYLSGPITLLATVNLQIDAGTKLQMLPKSSWPSTATPFIGATSVNDVEISGTGTIDGQGSSGWWAAGGTRPNFIWFQHCQRAEIQGVWLQNAPTFHIMVHNNNGNLTIQNMTINTPDGTPNTDGIDLASTNVLIRNCNISDGDDDIQIGSSSAFANNITISNCTFGTGHGLSIGSPTQDGVNNLLVSNCFWVGTEYGVKGKSDASQGGTMQNLRYLDVHMTNVNFPIAFYSHYDAIMSPSKTINVPPATAASTACSAGTLIPVWKNITISNLTAFGNSGPDGPGNITGIIWGCPTSPISNMTLIGVTITNHGSGGTFCIYHARGIKIIDSNLTTPTSGTNTLTIYNAEVTVTNSAANTNVVTMTGLGSPSNSVLSIFNGLLTTRDPSVFGANPLLTLASSILTVSNDMSLGNSSTLNFGLGTNVTKTVVTGNLTLGGTLNVADGGGFNSGTLTLFTYSGALTYTGLTVGTKPNTNFTYTVSTNTAGQVNLIVSGGVSPPTANFTGSPTGGTAPLPVNFTDSSSGSITNWFWDFGDGNTTNFAVTTNPSHTYNAGTFTVSLTVSGVGGTNTLTRSNYIVATNPPPPVANFTASPVSGTEPLLVTFTDASTGTAPLSLSWNLGDSATTNTAGGVNFTHMYAAGSYTVTLTASNFVGASTLVSNNLINVVTVFQAWQQQYFGCTGCPQAAPDADPLGKGMSNTNQFLAGLDPTNSASALRIISAVPNTTDVMVTWTTAGVRTNALQATSGDANGGYTNNFVDVSGPIIIDVTGDTTTNYLDAGGATNVPSRFYRIRLVP